MKRLFVAILAIAVWGCSGDEEAPPPGPDTSGPRVTATSPTAGDSNVALDALINVTFSEEVDPMTVTGLSFRVDNGVTGAITRGSRSASLEPAESLFYGVTYTATVTSAVTDVAGNHMDANHVWSFTTVFDEFIPLAVGNRWEFLVINQEIPDQPDTTLDTIYIADDSLIQSERWFVDQNGVLLTNRTGGVWRIKPGGQPHLFLKYPGVAGQTYGADPAINEVITIDSTNVQVSSLLNNHLNCYKYISNSDDTSVRWEYYYKPQLGPVKLVRFEGQTDTVKETWLFIQFVPAVQ